MLTDQAARDRVLPPALQGRPLEDYLVVDALERWAAGQAAEILSALFVVAAIVTAVAILPTLAMRNRPGAQAGQEARERDQDERDGATEGQTAALGF